MLFYLFLLFIVLPVLEVVILVKIGMVTSIWVPIAIVVVTGVVGTALARHEGWKVLSRIQDDVRRGQMPADSLIDGFLVLVAGLLFLLPGILTDVLAIILLFPPSRQLVKRAAAAWFKRNMELHVGRIASGHWTSSTTAATSEHDKIIDARVIGTRVEDAKRRVDS
jgi:UPF0716 protein FxsA